MATPKSATKPIVNQPRTEKPVVERKNGYMIWLINAWIFIPAMLYMYRVNLYALNLPMLDDFHAILSFLIDFQNAPSFMEKMTLMFSQHADHRIFHSRLVYVLYHALFGRINFRTFIILGNLQLIVVFAVMAYFIKRAIPKYWNIAALVVGICIFDLSSYENADFAMCGLQNYGIIMLFMVSMFFYSRNGNKALIAAGVFEAVCIFSSGNGPVCALILFFFVFLRKEKMKMIVSGSIFAVCSALYYVGYSRVVPLGYVPEEHTPGTVMQFFFHLVGGHFSFEYGVMFGVLVIAMLIFLFPFSKNKATFYVRESAYPLICLLGVMMATVLSITLFRVRNDMHVAYGSRYLVMSHMLAAIAFLFLWMKVESMARPTNMKIAIIAIAALGLLYTASNNYDYGESCLQMTYRRLQNLKFYSGPRGTTDFSEPIRVTTEACKMDIYCIDEER